MPKEKFVFSPEQNEAIHSGQKRLLVSASAGSGKTKVLVERILDFLGTRKISLNNMLVVTFTKLASLEMKSRLKTELEKLAINDTYYQQELENLSIANISTLHKFCQNMLREFFYIVQIDPNFQVLEDTTSRYLKNKALDNIIESYEQNADIEFNNILELFYENRDETVFKQNIILLSDFFKSKTDDFFENTLQKSYDTNFERNQAVDFIKGEIGEVLDFFSNLFSGLLLKANQLNNAKLLQIVQTDFQNIQTLKNAKFENISAIYKDIKFATHRSDKTFTSEDIDLLTQTMMAVKSFKTEFEKYEKCFNLPDEKKLQEDFALNKKMLSKLYEIVKKFDSEYDLLKQEKNVLDFNDLEHYTLKLLKTENIKRQLQQRFQGIFVDEYQDTNEIQEAIISSLSSDNYVFMVGDVKQSIYNFRNCNPQIFINKSVNLLNQDKKQLILLNKNYRSDKNILEFANLVFDNIMTQTTSELDYKNTSRLVFGDSIKTDNQTNVNILLVDTVKQDDDEELVTRIYSVRDDRPELSETKKIDTEALLIASQIVQLQNKKIYDSDIKDFRQIEYKDVAILTRTKESIKHISNVLTNCGIPVNSEYRVPIFDCYEVKVLVNILKVINNGQDDIALASVLKAVMFDLTDGDLAKIKLSFSDISFCDAVRLYTEKNDELSKKIKEFFVNIEFLRKKLCASTISELLLEVIKIFGLDKKFSSFENYLEICQNIDYFISIISQIENNNLSALINYINEFSAHQNADISLKNSLNSVYIGTIHSSKGLEYPIVFLADTNKQFSTISLKEKLIKNNQLGISMSTYNIFNKTWRESIIKNIFKFKTMIQEKHEEMRLLYVALTRAKNMLYVVGSCDVENVEKLNSAFQIKNAKSYLAWILGSLSDMILSTIKNKKSVGTTENDAKYQVKVFNNSEILFENSSTKNILPNNTFEKQLNDYFNIKFDNNPYAFKNTVTALLNTENEQVDYNIKDLKIKSNLEQNDDTDFLAIGTIYHKVMEHIDFSNASQTAIEVISNLVASQDMTELDAQMVDSDKIDKCKDQIALLIDNNDVLYKEKEFIFYPKLSNILSTEYHNRVLVQGKVDLMIIKPEGIVLVDYKTSRIADEEKLKREYQLQLNLYAKAIESFYGKKVIKKIIYSFYLDKLIIV